MKKLLAIALGLIFIVSVIGGSIVLAGNDSQNADREEGALSVADLPVNPLYGKEVKVYGRVNSLGEFFCPCFELTSDGATILVWYDLMTDGNGTPWPAVSVEGIENGDDVIVTGVLKEDGPQASSNGFWAITIEKSASPIQTEESADDILIGGTPGSCGYVWDAERGGWHRPWDTDSFIPADGKQDWNQFIPGEATIEVK